jgi:hypothetical protein
VSSTCAKIGFVQELNLCRVEACSTNSALGSILARKAPSGEHQGSKHTATFYWAVVVCLLWIAPALQGEI